MADVHFEPSEATLGATVTNVDLADLSGEEWQHIEAAFHDCAVLVFPAQHLSPAEQADFGRRFGDLAIESMVFSNESPDGTMRPVDDPLVALLRGNEGWHTDSSFKPLAAKASILSAVKVPSTGGETEWADMRAAYDALDDVTRRYIASLSAYHSLQHSQSLVGQGAESTAVALAVLTSSSSTSTGAEVDDPPLRPLVKVHPVTGRPALFIGRHAFGIPGLEPGESAQLLSSLLDDACQPPRVLQHRWSAGDVVIWDNRSALHRATAYDAARYRRLMQRTTIANPDILQTPAYQRIRAGQQ